MLASWLHRKGKPDCETCRECHVGKEPDCKQCGLVELLPNNVEVYTLICRYMPMLMADDIKPEGIRLMLDEEGYTDLSERSSLVRKTLAYLAAAKTVSME